MPRFLAGLVVAALILSACPPDRLTAQGTRLLRQPTVSSTQIAFAYAGDIWITGARAAMPVGSPAPRGSSRAHSSLPMGSSWPTMESTPGIRTSTLPYLFRHLKLGPLVGGKTWGGLVGIWDVPNLVDDGFITAPRGGFFNVAGQWDVENVGVTPDIVVEQTPAELIKGRDPQLERAIQEGLRLLAEHPVELKSEPAPPVRVRRP